MNLKESRYVWRIFLLFVTVCISSKNQVNAQASLKLTKSEVDFGKISSLVYPAKTVEFINAGKSKLAILLVEKGPNVKVNFERRFYQPGEKGIIYLYYEVRDKGAIAEEIYIHNNLDEAPQILKIKGNAVSAQECFPDINNLNLRDVLVVNKVTQAPVPKATLTFVRNHNTSRPVSISMDKAGKATEEFPIGLYEITAGVDGYEPYKNELFIPKTMPSILVELTPVSSPIPVEKTILQTTPAETNAPAVTSSDLPENKYAANNIILLLDVSTSMKSQKKFSLLQQSVNNLAIILRPIDYVTIITYASDAKVVLRSTKGDSKELITGTVQELVPSGTTQGVKGLNTAYEMAARQYIQGGNNQIILATDGEFSEKGVTDEYYQKFITENAQKGIKLSILGFGVNQAAIERMKKMAGFGNGTYIHISSEKFAKEVLVEEIKNQSIIK